MAIWSAIPVLGGVLDSVIKKVLPDRSKINEGQQKLNEAEINGAPSSRLRLWRGFLFWCLSLCFVWEVIGRPIILTYWPDTVLPPSMLAEISKLLLAGLGLGW